MTLVKLIIFPFAELVGQKLQSCDRVQGDKSGCKITNKRKKNACVIVTFFGRFHFHYDLFALLQILCPNRVLIAVAF